MQDDQVAATYDPNYLLDAVNELLNLKSDAALARRPEVSPPVISRLRHRKISVGPTLLIAMHEETGLSIRALRDLMKDRRKTYREVA